MDTIKKMHFIWGNDVLSYYRYLTLLSFRTYNPDWEIYFHTFKSTCKVNPWITPEKQDNAEYNGRDYMDKIGDLDIKILEYDETDMHPVHVSDIYRWQIINEYGGFYCDMDVLFINKVSDELLELLNDETAIGYSHYYYIPEVGNENMYDTWPIGFLYSTKNNGGTEKIYDWVVEGYKHDSYQAAGFEVLKYRFKNDIGIESRIGEYNPINMERCGIYTHDCDQVYKMYSTISENTGFGFSKVSKFWEEGIQNIDKSFFGIHWYGGHQLSQNVNNKLSETDFSILEDTILGHYLAKLLGDIENG